jgi:hypothetical protein
VHHALIGRAGFVALAGGVWINWPFRGDRRGSGPLTAAERSQT